MNERLLGALVAVTCLVGIIAGVTYIAKTVPPIPSSYALPTK